MSHGKKGGELFLQRKGWYLEQKRGAAGGNLSVRGWNRIMKEKKDWKGRSRAEAEIEI